MGNHYMWLLPIAQRKEDRKMQLQVQFSKRVEAGGSSSSAFVIPETYPPLCYPNTQPGMVYQPYPFTPWWNSANLINSSYPSSQAVTYAPMVANAPRKNKENRKGKLNKNSVSYVPQMYQSTQMLPLSRDFSNQQHNRAYGSEKELKKSVQETQSETIESEKQILGVMLYPLVEELHPQLAAKITGLLRLIKAPQDLAAQVKEAVEVLKSSKKNLPGPKTPNSLRSDYLASGVLIK